MPRVVIPDQIQAVSKNSLMVSGNLDYFVRYGLALAKSHLDKDNKRVSLIINCVDFSLGTAQNLLLKYFGKRWFSSIYLIKTDLNPLGTLTPDQKLSYLKTIRFYVGLLLRKYIDINLIICDIDALVTNDKLETLFLELTDSSTTLGVGSTINYFDLGLYQAGQKNYLWRAVKAGFTYFKKGDNGTESLKRISQCLFNHTDLVPPIDELKLYRAYYGDQLAIFFTSLENNSAPTRIGHVVKCVGYGDDQIVTFGGDPDKGSIWIPPASKRNDSLFMLN
jgi:hypothetical protein